MPNIKNPFGREIFTCNEKRTILDLIRNKGRVDMGIFSESIKPYFENA